MGGAVADSAAAPELAVSEGTLLGGRVRYTQPETGFRSGIEPVLLAASIPARPGQRVLEAGSGAGAGLLCLAARVKGLRGTGVECDAALAALAARNAAANGFNDVAFAVGRIEDRPPAATFDHAFANPPYHVIAGTPPASEARRQAKRAGEDVFAVWARHLASALCHRGTLTLVAPAAALPACLAAFAAAGCGSVSLLPLWPRNGVAAKLLIVRGVKGGRAALRLLAGLTLHDSDGAFTVAAEAILRHAGDLPL